VSVDPTDRGQRCQRPARWTGKGMEVLEGFGCDWGNVVDIADDGAALVLGYIGFSQACAFVWRLSG
jgi:hypothetical protein